MEKWKSSKKIPIRKSEKKRTKSNQRSPSTNFQALIRTVKAEGFAYRKEEKREDGGKARREWATIVLLLCTLIAVGWQVHEMIKVYGPIKEQADAAAQQAKAMANTVQVAKENMVASERAWVAPLKASAKGMPAAGKNYQVSLNYQNTGREPATQTTYGVDAFVMSAREDKIGFATTKINDFIEKCKITWEPQQTQVVFPSESAFGGGYTLYATFPVPKLTKMLSQGKSHSF